MINQIPNNWQKMKLGKTVDITSSKRIFAREYLKEGIPFYRGKEIIEKFSGDKITLDLFISQKKYDEIKAKFGVPHLGDMLLTSVGTLGVPYLVDKDEKFYFKDGNLTWFRKHNGIDNKFLFYWIQSSLGKEQLMKHTIGSSQQALTIEGLKNIDIFLPAIDEQKRIASILSSFDYKIELNNKIAKTLEDMANAIFKEWFVKSKIEFRKGNIGELTKVKHGFAFPSKKFKTKGEIPVIKIKNILEDRSINTNNVDFINKNDFKDLVNFKINNGDILIALTGATSGKIGILIGTYKEYLLNQRVGKFAFNKNYYKWFCYIFLTQSSYRNLLLNSSNGSAQGNLSPDQIESIEISIPNDELLEKFNNTVNSFYEKIIKSKLENQQLTQIRDLFLPKLIKGEIRV